MMIILFFFHSLLSLSFLSFFQERERREWKKENDEVSIKSVNEKRFFFLFFEWKKSSCFTIFFFPLFLSLSLSPLFLFLSPLFLLLGYEKWAILLFFFSHPSFKSWTIVLLLIPSPDFLPSTFHIMKDFSIRWVVKKKEWEKERDEKKDAWPRFIRLTFM